MNDGLVDSSIMLPLASLDRSVVSPSGAEGKYPCHLRSVSHLLTAGAFLEQKGVSVTTITGISVSYGLIHGQLSLWKVDKFQKIIVTFLFKKFPFY
jgi:hypothetical protein